MGTILWVVQAITVAVVASHLFSRLAQRLAPLSALLKMTLIFPDHAPSRFGLALRAGTVGKLREHEISLSGSVQHAAEQAIELVVQLGKHERSTRGHTERVRAHADLIGQELGLSDEEMNMLRWGVLLHDVGKLSVPAEILNKVGTPTNEEWAVLQRHPVEGAKILEPLAPWLGQWALAASQHHERWDGSGYPAGLSGEEISMAGRIAAVADAFDVITSKRSYKPAMSIESARRELVACSGTQFDPNIVRAFLSVGLHQNHTLGKFSWLVELPSVLRVTTNVATVPLVAASAAVSATAMVGGLAPAPAELAFDAGSPPPAVTFEDTTSSTPAVATSAPSSTEPATEASPAVVADITTSTYLDTTASSGPISSTTVAAPTTAAVDPATVPPSTATSTTQPAATALPSTAAPTTMAPAAAAAPTTAPTTPATVATTAAPATKAPTTTAGPTTTIAPTTTTEAPTTTTTAPTTTTAAAPSSPTGTGFALLASGDLPGALTEGSLTSSSHVFLFEEHHGLVLAAPLTVRSFAENVATSGSSKATTTIAAGSSICVWFIHGDPDGITNLDATIDFQQPILGFALSTNDLESTDQFATPGLNYAYRGLGSPDSFTAAGNQLALHADYRLFDVDQLRVFTSC